MLGHSVLKLQKSLSTTRLRWSLKAIKSYRSATITHTTPSTRLNSSKMLYYLPRKSKNGKFTMLTEDISAVRPVFACSRKS